MDKFPQLSPQYSISDTVGKLVPEGQIRIYDSLLVNLESSVKQLAKTM